MEKYGTTKKGSRLYMTDSELLTSYRQAADPIGQILVLAELNAMEEVEMREYLLSIGAVIDLSICKKRTIRSANAQRKEKIKCQKQI